MESGLHMIAMMAAIDEPFFFSSAITAIVAIIWKPALSQKPVADFTNFLLFLFSVSNFIFCRIIIQRFIESAVAYKITCFGLYDSNSIARDW